MEIEPLGSAIAVWLRAPGAHRPGNRQVQGMQLNLPVSVVLTCEHGGHRVPSGLKELFAGADEVLQSHRGWDLGALPLAKRFAAVCDEPLFSSTVSRLVVELNRSLGHPRLFSEFTQKMTPQERRVLLRKYWYPHRSEVEEQIRLLIDAGETVIHLSVHTFTETFEGKQRTTDVGLLYDPQRARERSIASEWRREIARWDSSLVVRRNDPYKGNSDGFTTYLRRQFPEDSYLGLELEVCQKFFLTGGAKWRSLMTLLPASFLSAIDHFVIPNIIPMESEAPLRVTA